MLQVEEYERMSKDVYRSAYTRRIMEIVGNIKKQKQEISKVKNLSVFLKFSHVFVPSSRFEKMMDFSVHSFEMIFYIYSLRVNKITFLGFCMCFL